MSVTTYVVTRDTARDNASDEDRAMAHVTIYSGDDLADAQWHLQQYLIDEAKSLTRGRTVYTDTWAFKRAVGLVELADEATKLDPHISPRDPHRKFDRITRTVDGLLFAINATTR